MTSIISIIEIDGDKLFITKKPKNSVLCQTDKIKATNRHMQTEAIKTRTVEVQVNSDSQVLSAIFDIKNKYLSLQEKKDDSIAKLNKKINELQEKATKDANSRKAAEQEAEKKFNSLKSEIHRLKEQLAESQKKQKTETEKNVILQKLLVEQINDKYNMHKQHYKVIEKQSSFMALYLKDLVVFLTPKTIPTDISCRQAIKMWDDLLSKIKTDFEQLNIFYQTARTDMINSDVYEINWPELPDMPRYEDNLVFFSFKTAIRNIIQMEEKVSKIANDLQAQAVRPPPQSSSSGPHNNYNYNFNPPQPAMVQPTTMRRVYTNIPTQQYYPVHYQNQIPVQYQNSGWPPNGRSTPTMTVGVERPPVHVANTNVRTTKVEMMGVTGHSEKENRPKPSKGGTHLGGACSQVNKANTNEKSDILFDYIVEHCIGCTEEEVAVALVSVINDHKGSLADLQKEEILEDVKLAIQKTKQSAWVTPKSPFVLWQNEKAEFECTICFEEIKMHDKYTLPCHHGYHKECIKKWLRTSSVCPICRIHCVYDDEYPPLH